MKLIYHGLILIPPRLLPSTRTIFHEQSKILLGDIPRCKRFTTLPKPALALANDQETLFSYSSG